MNGWERQEARDIHYLLQTGRSKQAGDLFRTTYGPMVDMIVDAEKNAIRQLGSLPGVRVRAQDLFERYLPLVYNANIQPEELTFIDTQFDFIVDKATQQSQFDARNAAAGITKDTPVEIPSYAKPRFL